MPAVSVIIPVYNRAGHIPAAIFSALGQSVRDIEVIVVDDGSADDTVLVVERIARQDDRVRLLRHDKNRGAAAARNSGIRAAQSAWLAFLDSDDVWLPEKLARQMAALDGASEADAVLCLCDAHLEKGNTGKLALRALPANPDWVRLIIEGKGLNGGATLFAPRALFDQERVGNFDESLRRIEDWDWFLRAVLAGVRFVNTGHADAIICVGVPPEVEIVRSAVERVRNKHYGRLLKCYGNPMDRRFSAALSLEIATASLWRGDVQQFTINWLRAFQADMGVACAFLTVRILRVLSGDAPRLFRIISMWLLKKELD